MARSNGGGYSRRKGRIWGESEAVVKPNGGLEIIGFFYQALNFCDINGTVWMVAGCNKDSTWIPALFKRQYPPRSGTTRAFFCQPTGDYAAGGQAVNF